MSSAAVDVERPTPAQVRLLQFFGVEIPAEKWRASRAIDKVMGEPANRVAWAREKLRAFPELRRAAGDPQDSHSEMLKAAILLVASDLSDGECRELLTEYARRSDAPWSGGEIEHKLRAASASRTVAEASASRGTGGREFTRKHDAVRREKPEFSPAALRKFAGEWTSRVDVVWLGNRSAVDPALVTPEGFLAALYGAGERVIVFNVVSDKGQQWTQGEAVWPDDARALPREGRCGVWYLIQPVTGQSVPNPRSEGKVSRRIEECVTSFRYLCLESDSADARDWMGALVQLPMRIAAIYTSGGRSIHVLVRVDAGSAEEWVAISKKLQRGLVILGADQQVAATKARLSRLPGCIRLGACVENEDGAWRYDAYAVPRLQKLLYLNPEPATEALATLSPRRNVLAEIEREVSHLTKKGLDGLREFRARCGHYAPASPRCERHAADLDELLAQAERRAA